MRNPKVFVDPKELNLLHMRDPIVAHFKGDGITGPCILQVEDNAQEVILQQKAFERVGIHNVIQVVTDGQHAIDYLAGKGSFSDRQEYPLPCLVLLKLKLQRQHGIEVLEWIRAQPGLRTLVVIAMCQWEQTTELERAYQLGANSCAIEPTDLDGWLDMARALKSWWLAHNRFAPVHRSEPHFADVHISADG